VPDFSARFTSANVTVVDWDDPERAAGTFGPNDPGAPSRLNPSPGHPMRRPRCPDNGSTVTVKATVGGVEGELDANLGGRLFYAWWLEYPGAAAPVFSNPGGQTSAQSFLPLDQGHHLFGIARVDGGAVLFHLDVEAP